MAGLIQYTPTILDGPPHNQLPGVSNFRYTAKLFSLGLAPLDRTGSITYPIRMKLIAPMPALRPMKKSFEEICNERALEILARAEKLGAPIYTFWSGGIDSTLVLISLLKNATPEQKKNIVVMMTEESIAEYPDFYRDHVYGKLRTDSSMMFPYMLGSNALITSGEQNDQLFGFDSIGKLILKFGSSILHKPYEQDTFRQLFNDAGKEPALTELFLQNFEKIMRAAPVPITTHFEYLWWINFSQKWQNSYLRMLTCVAPRNTPKITKEYMDMRYVSFYGTDDFQLWSMQNNDKKIKDEWRTYKWTCKDIIYDYTKDKDYRDNKTKRGSLRYVIVQQESFGFIDENFKFYRDLDASKFYVPENDFVSLPHGVAR